MKNLILLVLIYTVFISTYVNASSPNVNAPATPLEPIESIAALFDSYDIVALDEGDHGNEQGHDFRLSLIRDPKFLSKVNDIVVEFGSAQYQGVMDKFINGEDVEYGELRKAWLNTTQPHEVWDVPIYEAFFRAVREVNLTMPKSKRLRVLLGEPPVEWRKINTIEDVREHLVTAWGIRDSHSVDVIKREVLAKGRKALVIYGGLHFHRKNIYWKYKDIAYAEQEFNQPVGSIVSLLEKEGVAVFSIFTDVQAGLILAQDSVSKWQIPSLTFTKGSTVGAKPYPFFYPTDAVVEDGVIVAYDADKSPSMQDQFNAILYLGPKSSITYSELSKEVCNDEEYLKLRLKRASLLGAEEGLIERCKIEE